MTTSGGKRMTMTRNEFRDRYSPCREARKWARNNCTCMADVWEKAKAEWLIWVATRPGVLDDRTLRLFACWCVRQVWHLLSDERSRHAIEVAERYAEGAATDKELATAQKTAWLAATAAPSMEEGSAEWFAAVAVTWAVSWIAAWAAVGSSRDAATAATLEAGATAATLADQADYLRTHVPCPWEPEEEHEPEEDEDDEEE